MRASAFLLFISIAGLLAIAQSAKSEDVSQNPAGRWESVDFVQNINDFNPEKKNVQGELFFKQVEFRLNGTTDSFFRWQNGLILHNDGKTKAQFYIKQINGSTYLFLPWLSGDVTDRGQKPSYYVLKKVSGPTSPDSMPRSPRGEAGGRDRPRNDTVREKPTKQEPSQPSAPASARAKPYRGIPVKFKIVPTKRKGTVEWKDNKITSRVLPYPDFTSLFIRLPIAHAAVDGNGVKIAVVGLTNDAELKIAIEQVAPGAQISTYTFPASVNPSDVNQKVVKAENRIAVIPDADRWNAKSISELAGQLQDAKILVIIPSDESEDGGYIETVNSLHSTGVLTVGRVNRQSMIMSDDDNKPFNSRIRDIQTDVFSTIGVESGGNPACTTAGVAALVLEKWPQLSPQQVREKIVTGARNAWQATSIETGQWTGVSVDQVTTKYTPASESAIYRFRVLDAAGAVEVDTEIPWFLNMLNLHKAWEITKGQGVLVVVSDQGFHIRHPALVESIIDKANFGPRTLDESFQNFHGTDMSRILLSVAPKAKIIPVLCSDPTGNREGLAENIAKSFDFAVEHKADVISASWAEYFNTNTRLINAINRAVDKGIVVSWFHYPRAYPGLLRSRLTYSFQENQPCIGFADRFLTDEPGFHPVEVEAGLSGTAPQAAGLAALAKSVNPQLKPVDIEKLIFDNSTPIGGNIRVPDAYKIVVAAKQMIKAGE